ncbi:MAG: hypothetical protein A2622_03110 [Bdellovibrionales bacterium RIFCSPHIGHO2_01_FULL_40_29]|nr:MAG: hypothetical protein A2622_03110 [Bdellovibrionales bacterium RIFCSPHIGHO2_01_FULL_40_29]OFZ34062.1 MAG: hypothetical protein A3D17_03530 [Bdellovibrionales bacterium RIFCSPHIGHO2_02_FULL_40_15]
MFLRGWVILFVFWLSGCITTAPPLEEYTLAEIAIKSARAVQAVRYSPGHWHQAEENYRQARILYNEREYEQAKGLFIKARISAERAENSARLLRQQNGDVL